MRVNLSRAWLAFSTQRSSAPFLYQTRTLAAPLSTTFQLQSQCSYSSEVNPPSPSHPNSDETPDPQETSELQLQNNIDHHASKSRKSYLRRRAASVPKKHDSTPRSSQRTAPTMTRSERQIFGGLLEKFGMNAAEPDEKHDLQNPSLGITDREEMAQISAIFNSVLQDLKKKRLRSKKEVVAQEKSSATTTETMSPELHENLGLGEKFRNPDYTNADISEALQNNYILMERAVELVVRRESAKIEAALHATINEHNDDSGIWAVCKERIFSMLQHLEGGRNQLEPPATTETDVGGISPEMDDTIRLEVPEEVPLEPVVVALYPKMLLVAFRLLNLHFPGSLLIDQFRATIKAQGRASAVLGSSTALYNELIYFYWRGCHDLPGVVSLLHEMEVTGVEPSGRTCALLSGIYRQREQDLKEHRHRLHQEPRGGLRQPWWDLAPNRRAVHSLLGPDGWIHRLEKRVGERKEREKSYSH
ncbi:hypothetical protein FE257_008801 [Aspergillus nanangensis]|uniref:Mtf2-like C-terminal domain-containing protein n=1 Tax=Aspergillus nanangensis TaxID=2582783 RepID=A0AAD4CLD5_ASPNN|nr:hypothetical protein FE257_008801 [Aspergillus nanangensis]